jgi:hypothetical protein
MTAAAKKNPHAVAMGKAKSEHKRITSAMNGRLGGRPRKTFQASSVRTGPMASRDRLSMAALLKSMHEQARVMMGVTDPGDTMHVRLSRIVQETQSAFEVLTARLPGDVLESDLDPKRPASWTREMRAVQAIARA